MKTTPRHRRDTRDRLRRTGSGRGGATGRPSHDLAEAPPSYDQEVNRAVSGGGLVGPDEDEPAHEARPSR